MCFKLCKTTGEKEKDRNKQNCIFPFMDFIFHIAIYHERCQSYMTTMNELKILRMISDQ